ncbi:MAG TPA: hypothetical protein EYN67_11855 [Flavobacteriales bacterium]|nr:hypothetical protein [Flavobacteriales bacterium]
MTKGTQPSQEVLEKNLLLTVEDWTNMFKDWCGNQKDTECGIHTRIHTDAGSVTLSSSLTSYDLKVYIHLELPQNKTLSRKSSKHN